MNVQESLKKIFADFDEYINKHLIAGLTLSILVVVLVQGIFHYEPFDDAYITYRYARNISNGHGFVYNLGEKVLGTTTPLYALLLALLGSVFHVENIPIAAYYISLVSDGISLWLLYRIANAIFFDRFISLLISVTFVLFPFRLIIANGGMETSIFLTSLLFTYNSYLLKNKSHTTSIFAAISFLIRPDAVIALIPIYIDWFLTQKRTWIKAVLILAICILPWILWSTYYFGSPIPNSILAKSSAYKNPIWHATAFLLFFFSTGTPGPYTSPLFIIPIILFALPVIIYGTWVNTTFNKKAWVITSYPIIYGLVMAVLNPSMIFPWYYVPLIPGFLVLAIGMVWFSPKFPKKSKYILSGLVCVYLTMFSAYLIIEMPSSLVSREREVSFNNACSFVKKEGIKADEIFAPDIGVIGWCFADSKILDPIGLVSPESFFYHDDLNSNEFISFKQIDETQPDLIISLDHFIDHDQIENVPSLENYQLVYEEKVTIIGDDHQLYILKSIKR